MRSRFFPTVVAAAVVFTACADAPTPGEPTLDSPAFAAAGQSPIADAYIVVFNDGVANVPVLAGQLVNAGGGDLRFVYEHALRGFAARLPAQAVAALRNHPAVAYIEQDQEFTITATQSNATWGLDRIDQRNLPLSTTYTYEATGAGVRAYILDTGIRATHVDFDTRVTNGFTAINDGRGSDDCNGHGTHVAGTVGGTTWGVAKSVALVPVRVLDCRGSGTTSGVIAGVDWVTANHVKPAVANMSLGGGASSTLDAAVANSIAAGVTYAVAAGNSTANACNYSPARVASAITVGATTNTDARASYSNFGNCLDLFAPGSAITSAWYTSNTATNTINGTSMASPHVAGVAALVLQGNPGASPAAVTNAILSNATTGKVTSAGSESPNLLLFMGFTGGTTEPPPSEPPPAEPPPSGFALAVNMTKSAGINYANLSWSGASGPVDVFRGATKVGTASGTTYTDNVGRGGGSASWKVCNTGTTTCSNVVSASW